MARQCAGICFIAGRVHFKRSDGKPYHPTRGSCLIYFGDDFAAFKRVFEKFGGTLEIDARWKEEAERREWASKVAHLLNP